MPSAKKRTSKSNSKNKKNNRKRSIKEIDVKDNDNYDNNPRKKQKIYQKKNKSNQDNKNSKQEVELQVDPVKALIKDLTPWSIKEQILLHARIIYKSKSSIIKGKNFFYIILMDETNQLMKMNFWEDQALKFKDLKQDDVIKIKQPSIRQILKQYQVYHKYQLSAGQTTEIIKEEMTDFPVLDWKFVNILNLLKEPDGKLIDVKAVCAFRYDVENLTSARGPFINFSFFQKNIHTLRKYTGKNLRKQTLTIQDATAKVDLILWNQQCVDSTVNIGDSVLVSKAKIKRWGGRTTLEIKGFAEFTPRADDVDEKSHVEQKSSTNISDESQLAVDFNWNKLTSSTIKQMLSKIQTHSQSTRLHFKIIGQIMQIDGEKMWYFDKTASTKKWRLQITICDEEHSTFEAVAFGASKMLINGLSATEAYQMQQNNNQAFSKMMEDIIDNEQKYQLHVQAEQHEYEGNVSSRFIIVNVKRIL